ncbi:MAG TPA: hypothetical protein VED16_04165, partial [Candidatus Acidoferrum sp.]|nr:hypothetical protein [Candidatus Acidoferrum sp.]
VTSSVSTPWTPSFTLRHRSRERVLVRPCKGISSGRESSWARLDGECPGVIGFHLSMQAAKQFLWENQYTHVEPYPDDSGKPEIVAHE